MNFHKSAWNNLHFCSYYLRSIRYSRLNYILFKFSFINLILCIYMVLFVKICDILNKVVRHCWLLTFQIYYKYFICDMNYIILYCIFIEKLHFLLSEFHTDSFKRMLQLFFLFIRKITAFILFWFYSLLSLIFYSLFVFSNFDWNLKCVIDPNSILSFEFAFICIIVIFLNLGLHNCLLSKIMWFYIFVVP